MGMGSIEDVKRKLFDMNKIISALDPAIRLVAFNILAPLFEFKKMDETVNPDDSRDFFGSFDHDKPRDNLLLIVAWLYSQYGLFPITAKEIQKANTAAGLTLPGRIDNTMKTTKNKKGGKPLFHRSGKGYQLTVHGEKYIKELYKVKRGTKRIPNEVPDDNR